MPPAQIPAAPAAAFTQTLGLDALPWSEQAKLGNPGMAALSGFGDSVAVSGDTALVGSYLASTGGYAEAGIAYVFVRTGTTWTLQASLQAPDVTTNALFGYAVALDGDTALIGAPGAGNGAVYAFVRSGMSWSMQYLLTAGDGNPGDFFGSGVAVKGDTAIIGAEDASPGGMEWAGEAYVFARSGSTWSQQATLLASDGQPFDLLGSAASLDGNTALVGAYDATLSGIPGAGAAYVFVKQSTGWSQQAKLIAQGPATQAAFGWKMGLSADTALIGALLSAPSGLEQAGAAYVFVRSGTSWTEQAMLTAADAAAGSMFGSAVTVAGDIALIGAESASPGGLSQAGAVYEFVRSGSAWTQKSQITASDQANGAYLGTGVFLDRHTAVIGAAGASTGGAVYVETINGEAANGATCTGSDDCASGYCVDGVCCNSACGGSATDCQACSMAAGAPSDGTCGAIADGTSCGAGVCEAGVCQKEADLDITLTAIPDKTTGLNPISLRATAHNQGTSPADQVTLYVALPSGAVLTSYAAPEWSCVSTESSLTCLKDTLAAEVSSSVLLSIVPPHKLKQFTIQGQVDNDVYDPVPANNTAAVSVHNSAPSP